MWVKLGDRGRSADLPVQHHRDRAARPQDRDYQRAAAGPVGDRGVLPLRPLQSFEPVGRQAVLVVRGAYLGRRRLGAGDGLDPRLPDAEADRRRPRSHREVALRHRRPGAVQRAARHRPPLLLDRHALILAARWAPSSRPSRSCHSLPWCCSLLHGLEGWPRPSQQGRPALEPRHRGHGLLRRRRVGVHAHAARDQLLHPRHPGDGGARPPRLLRRLRQPEPRDHHLRHALPVPARGVQPGVEHGQLLGDVERHGVHDLHPDLRRRRPDAPAAGPGAELHGRPGRTRPVLPDAARRRHRRGHRRAAVHLRDVRPAAA